MTSSDKQTWFEISDSQRDFAERRITVYVSTVLADDLAPSGVRASASTVLTKVGRHNMVNDNQKLDTYLLETCIGEIEHKKRISIKCI